MKNNINIYGMAGIVFITFCTTLAIKDVGTLSCEKPYIVPVVLPVDVFLILFIPFLLGFFWGRSSED